MTISVIYDRKNNLKNKKLSEKNRTVFCLIAANYLIVHLE